MDALYAEAQALVAQFEDDRLQAEMREREDHVRAIKTAQAQLLRTVTDGLADRVMQAAREGKRELELLAFEGGDTFDGEFCYLYLLKGPRQPEDGVEPLLPRLRKQLLPFSVRHVWRQGTVQNRVVMAWA